MRGLGAGFERGFNIFEGHVGRERAHEAREQAGERQERQVAISEDRLDLAREGQESTQQYQADRLDLARTQAENTNQHRDRTTALAENQDERAAGRDQRQIEQEELARLKEASKANFARVVETGQYDPAIDQKAHELGAPNLAVDWWANDDHLRAILRLREPLNAVGQGDFSVLNNPEVMRDLSTVYKEQINKGVGEMSATAGKKIVSKELAKLDAAPGHEGGVVASVRVQYEDGTTDVKPISLLRSSDPNDPVAVMDAGEMIDDVQGHVRLAEIFTKPEVIENVQAGLNQVRGAGGGEQRDLPADAEMLEYLMGDLGMTQDEALEYSKRASTDPSGRMMSIFRGILDGQPYGQKDPEAALIEAQRLAEKYAGKSSGGGGQFKTLAEALTAAKQRYPNRDEGELRAAIKRKYPDLK